MTTHLLDTPVLTLAIDSLSQLQSIDENQLSAIWNCKNNKTNKMLVFTKVKDNLENGRRLENISWRLWYRSAHPPSGSSLPVDVPALLPSNPHAKSPSLSLVLDREDWKENARKRRLAKQVPTVEVQQPALPVVANAPMTLIEPCIQQDEIKESLARPKDRATFFIASCSNTSHTSSLSSSLDPQQQQLTLPNQFRQHHIPDSLSMKRQSCQTTLMTFIPSEHGLSDDSTQARDEDFSDSVCSSDFLSDEDTESCYGASWSYSTSPLFGKVSVNSRPRIESDFVPSPRSVVSKPKSLLSAALTQSRPLPSCPDSNSIGLSSSLRQTLFWDRVMPFNTTVQSTESSKKMKSCGQPWSQEEEEYW